MPLPDAPPTPPVDGTPFVPPPPPFDPTEDAARLAPLNGMPRTALAAVAVKVGPPALSAVAQGMAATVVFMAAAAALELHRSARVLKASSFLSTRLAVVGMSFLAAPLKAKTLPPAASRLPLRHRAVPPRDRTLLLVPSRLRFM